MQTSDFSRLAEIAAAGLTPIAITRAVPESFRGQAELRLALNWRTTGLTADEFDALLKRQLDFLDPQQMWRDLNGPVAVLLCHEPPDKRCHRRAVAEWFEKHLLVTVPEFGFDRNDTPPYRSSGRSSDSSRPASSQPKPTQTVPAKFDVDFFG